jgi:hypothetical protein
MAIINNICNGENNNGNNNNVVMYGVMSIIIM